MHVLCFKKIQMINLAKLKGPAPSHKYMKLFEGVEYDIKSPKHDLIKRMAMLRRSSTRRFETSEIFVKGLHTINAHIAAGATFSEILVTAENKLWATRKFESCQNVKRVPREVLQYLVYDRPFHAKQDDAQLVVGITQMPTLHDISQGLTAGNYLVLESIQDPKNVANLVATAHGMRWQGVIPLDKTCDFFEWKSLEAGSGAVSKIPLFKKPKTLAEVVSAAVKAKLLPLVGHIEGVEPTAIDRSSYRGVLLLVGNEGQGPSQQALELFSRVTIPMAKAVNSLNVAIAGGILMNVLTQARV